MLKHLQLAVRDGSLGFARGESTQRRANAHPLRPLMRRVQQAQDLAQVAVGALHH